MLIVASGTPKLERQINVEGQSTSISYVSAVALVAS
jgi:hypothetical protein